MPAVYLTNVTLRAVGEAENATAPLFELESKFPGPRGLETRKTSVVEVVRWAEDSLRAKGLDETIATFPFRDTCPDLYRVMGKRGYECAVKDGGFRITRHEHFLNLEGHDPRKDETEGKLRRKTKIDFDIVSPDEQKELTGVGSTSLQYLYGVTVDEGVTSETNRYILCCSEPFSGDGFEKFGRHCIRIRSYPVFIAALNIQLQSEEKSSEMDGTAQFIQAGPVEYLKKKMLRSKSLRDPKRRYDPIWFKPRRLRGEEYWKENEFRPVWELPNSYDEKYIEVTSEDAKKLIKPYKPD